ncbi:MAG TPA: cation-transporting P-type ATPase [Holophagaceae bacterium]|nr:cation-transporting P-type ATPase [Holophagaceae bacterium]
MSGTRPHIQHLTSEEALRSLGSGPEGLPEAEAARRLREFGPNALERLEREPALRQLLRQFIHFFALLLWVAAGLAFAAGWRQPGSGMGSLGFAIVGVILVNGLFSFWQAHKAEAALEALKRLLPQQVRVARPGRVVLLPAWEVVPGDVLLLGEGDAVPADCRLLEAEGIRVDTATVTGESVPKTLDADPSDEESVLAARNLLLAGTGVVSGQGRAVVYATGMRTEFGAIARMTQQVEKGLSPLQAHVARLSRWIGALSLGIGLVFFLLGHRMGIPPMANLMFTIGVIVANVPEGLLPTVTLALAMGAQRLARKQALVRHLPAVEALGSATVICTDKTGTLTENRMEVRRLFVAGREAGHEAVPAAVGSLPSRAAERLMEGMALCHGLRRVEGAWRGDPMEQALVAFAEGLSPQAPGTPAIQELAFDADRRRMSTLHRTPDGLRLHTKGAPETLLELATAVLAAEGPAPLTDALRRQLQESQARMADAGLRVLAFATRDLAEEGDAGDLERELVITGLVGLEDPPRAEVAEAMAICHRAGIKVIMITGDHPRTALAIGRETGLLRGPSPVVVTGEELRRLSDTQLQLRLEAPEILFARMGAEQKLRIVQALKRKGHLVAVTGDGVNDAPALREADIGIAMGRSGTEVAKEAADMVLLDDHFATLVRAIEEGRAVFDNVRKFLTYHMSSNVAELAPYLAWALLRVPLGLTVIQILMVDLGTDMVPALGLGAEPPEPGAMDRPPRRPSEPILTSGLVIRTYLWLGAVEAAAGLSGFFFVLGRGGWRLGQALGGEAVLYRQATAACLAGIILTQMMNVFVCRHPRASAFAFPWLGNRLLLAGVALEALLLMAFTYLPPVNRILGTAAFPAETWLVLLPFPLALLLLEEGRKVLLRRRGWQGGVSGTARSRP